jgi:hypothetical protein
MYRWETKTDGAMHVHLPVDFSGEEGNKGLISLAYAGANDPPRSNLPPTAIPLGRRPFLSVRRVEHRTKRSSAIYPEVRIIIWLCHHSANPFLASPFTVG